MDCISALPKVSLDISCLPPGVCPGPPGISPTYVGIAGAASGPFTIDPYGSCELYQEVVPDEVSHRFLASIPIEKDQSKYLSYLFANQSDIRILHFFSPFPLVSDNFDGCFYECSGLFEVGLPWRDTRASLMALNEMFSGCEKLQVIDMSRFGDENVLFDEPYAVDMFKGCDRLDTVICHKAFHKWCMNNMDDINLPDTMRPGGRGRWIIVDPFSNLGD